MEQRLALEVSGSFGTEEDAELVAEALNRWFAWISAGSRDSVPSCFEGWGVDSAEYAWRLEEDVDWTLGPHARVVDTDVRIAVQTAETHRRIAGLLRALGARSTRILFET